MDLNARYADEYNAMQQPIVIKEEKIEIVDTFDKKEVPVIDSSCRYGDDYILMQPPVEIKDEKMEIAGARDEVNVLLLYIFIFKFFLFHSVYMGSVLRWNTYFVLSHGGKFQL